jgi:hypothetical protein
MVVLLSTFFNLDQQNQLEDLYIEHASIMYKQLAVS